MNDYVLVRTTVINLPIPLLLCRRFKTCGTALVASLLVLVGTTLRAYGMPAYSWPSYQGEYVVTLKPQSVSGGQVGVLSSSNLESHVTVLQTLRSQTLVVSDRLQASPSEARRVSALESLVSPEDEFCKRLLAHRVVESCTPNFQLQVSQVGADPLMSSLWGVTDELGVGAVSAWGTTDGSSDVVVAVIDTGIDYTHEDLAANIWTNPGEVDGNGVDDDGNGYIDDVRGINFAVDAPNVVDPMDDNQHGTHVAGTIGAVPGNGMGVRGISGGVKLLPIKFMDAGGSGRLSDAIAAIDYMVDLKVNRGVNIRVANNSWGGGGYSAALEDAIRRARDAGIIFVVAAGNSATNLDLFPAYPASYDVENIVSVAAIDQAQNLAAFSNYGAEGVDIAAPGVDITSTLPGQGYGALSGTSMATPHVVGSLALLLSVEPGLSVSEAITRLLDTGRDVGTLVSPDGTLSYVRSRRVVSAARLLSNTRTPVRDPNGGLPPCGYQFQASNLVPEGALDDAADKLNPINQVDEGDFRAISLPFDFPFFRTTTRVLYVSPNGVVYSNPPRSADYQVAKRAPNNSIAAFHADLIPRNSKQGIRAYVGADRVVIFWYSEHYSLTDRGPISIRLTLYRSGFIRSTVSFESAKDPTAISKLALGDPFGAQPTPALGLIGASATSLAYSSTVDIAAAQRGLLPSSGGRLDLAVNMVPTCFNSTVDGPPEQQLQMARVDSIKLKLTSNQRKMGVALNGVGSGKIPVRAAINGRLCEPIAWGSLAQGKGAFNLTVPRTARKVTVHTSDAKATIQVRGSQSSRRREKQSAMCAELLRAVR